MTSAKPSRRRRAALCVLVPAVLGLHLWLANGVLRDRLGEGASDRSPAAIEVAFVKTLAPSLPPVAVAPPPAPRPRPKPAAAVPRPAASAPEPETARADPAMAPDLPDVGASQPELAAAEAPPVVAEAASAAGEPASAPVVVSAASAASAPEAFDWPPSTRLSYHLTLSNYSVRPIYGSARVEWLRQAEHYQVRVVAKVPGLVERRLLSDGLLGPEGLVPQRFDQETEALMMSTRRETVLFRNGRVEFTNGKTAAVVPGLQDSSSQFVQTSWWFLTHPELLKPGQVLEVPLALTRRLGVWRYIVQPPEILQLPMGPVQAYMLKPELANRKANELLITMWIAPSLQYLPVKVTMQQDPNIVLDMVLEGSPLQSK
ncbi:DUF3108 domain-containing protein [Ideonella azotifigens]|uniref:DUF3108 domain-containing protein n=2 Tax=Ideonella azotifigens TaxID=513160 RepID=A0ABN1K0I3_9BURK|nr:DUF3108 domain-containing protein [Ideonella azotifigens]MCD2341552.1 DUF3108 domain-containing protein [Ideonella azotifigens]